jgi:hypothetical protein
MRKHLLSSIAMASLLAAGVPALAQTDTAPKAPPPAAQQNQPVTPSKQRADGHHGARCRRQRQGVERHHHAVDPDAEADPEDGKASQNPHYGPGGHA